MPVIVRTIVDQAINLYMFLIFAYVIASWFSQTRWVSDLRRAIAPICEPYLGLFRSFIPAAGGLDFSPAIAIIVLSLVRSFVYRLLS